MEPDWYASEIINGLTKLLSLSLDGTPARDSVEITAATWIESTTFGRAWDQSRDVSRIRSAFVTLACTRDRWPTPKQFLDALPRIEQRAIQHDVTPATPEQAKAALANIARTLRVALPDHRAPPAVESRPHLAEIERELREHYARQRTAEEAK